ncbi:MAG: Wzz/FepE/Etk N-terminal domain-containing protein [Syntrophaceae bacterium]|nr:Wzz/FepE/Etk N-terminal domain-containing protein [Syntrophaceae bacterium]
MQNIFREFIFILFYRLPLIIVVFLTVFIISMIVAVTLPPVYSSTAKLSLIIPDSFDPLQRESSYDYRNRMRRYLQDQKELIISNRVLTRVVQELYPDVNGQAKLTEMIDKLREKVTATPPGGETFEGSSVFILEATDRDPVWAAKLATSLTDNYIATYREVAQDKSNFSHSFFSEQTEKLYRDMQEKENRVRDFETKQALALLEILNLGDGKANVEVGPNMLLTQFMQSYHNLQTELAGLQTSIRSIEKEVDNKGIPTVLPEMEVTGRSITVFKNKVAQLQLQLNEMKPQFEKDFEPMRQVEQELSLSVSSLREELKRTVHAQKITALAIQARIGQLENIIQGLQERIQTIAREKATYQALVQEFNLAKDAYSAVQKQTEQARLAQSLNQDKQYLTLIDSPEIPTKPFKPNRKLLALGGLFSGLFLGIAAALTIDHFDHRMKTVYGIEKNLNIPVLGSIPSV